MPIQAPQWTEFLSCPICFNIFDERGHRPISLGCGHTVCKNCLSKLTPRKCPFDQNSITRDIEELPVNYALLQLVGVAVPESEQSVPTHGLAENVEYYNSATRCIEELAMYLKPSDKESQSSPSPPLSLSRPMQRKLVSLLNCQLIEEEGRARAVRAARSLGERTVTELILQHQNPQQLSANLWAGVRARGCQFLGPAMQEEVLKLILLALEDGSPLSRKVLVLFVVQRLESQYPQASKTAIGHVVQLLYRASCFKVTKREEESSLMQLKEEFCTYEALRREHDSQIVQIATEAGLRISPEQWSSLLYGDTAHKSHMQSIIDKLQTPQSFSQSINELTMALQRTGDPGNLVSIKVHLDLLANVDPSPDSLAPTWEILDKTMQAIKAIVEGLVEFSHHRSSKKQEFVPLHNPKYKTSMCRDLVQKGKCPRGTSCTFAHSPEELERYRQMSKKGASAGHLPMQPAAMTTLPSKVSASSALTPQERESLKRVIKSSNAKMSGMIHRDPQVVTAGLPRGTSDTTDSCHSMKRADGRPVSVPIAKACSLPTNTRAKMESSIYSLSVLSDKVEEDCRHPGIIPVAKKVSSLKSNKQGQGLQPSQLPGRPPPQQQHQKQHPQQYVYNAPGYCPNVSSQSVYTPTASLNTKSTHMEARHVQMASPELQQFPRNGHGDGVTPAAMASFVNNNNSSSSEHYSLDCYGLNARDRAHYSSHTMRGRGKSPSEQLEELQCRKSELLAQLNKTRTATQEGGSVSENSADSPAAFLSEDEPLTSFQSVFDLNEVSNSMLHHLGLSQQVSTCASTSSTTSMYHMENHKSQGHASASTYSTMSLTQDNLQSWGGESRAEEDFLTWSSGDEMVDINMTPVLGEQEEQVYTEDDKSEIQTWEQEWDSDDAVVSKSVADELDEFVPFSEDYSVSKYGPISRMVKTKLRQQGPVQVTAGEIVFNQSGTVHSPFYNKSQETHPVNAVTPMQRPYPVTSLVPSRFLAQTNRTAMSPSPSPILQGDTDKSQAEATQKETMSKETKAANEASQKEVLQNPQARKDSHHVHKADPNGMQVAASLPTALLQPNMLTRANRDSEPHTLWMLRQRMTCQEQNQIPPTSGQPYEPKNLRSEIADLNSKIEHLQSSEDERLVRELQAIELSIVQAERRAEQPPPPIIAPQPTYPVINKQVPPQNMQVNYPEQPAVRHVHGNVMEQPGLVSSGSMDRNRQPQNYYLGGAGVEYMLAREAQKMEIYRQNAKVWQESSDRLYAEDIAKREMEKFVRSSKE